MEPSTWVALAIALFGGAGIKVVEKFLNRNKDREDLASRMREELRVEIERHKKRADEAEDEADQWRDRYYRLLEERELKNAADRNL